MQATANNVGGLQPQEDGAPVVDDRYVLVQNLLAKRREAIAGRAGSGIEEEWTEDEEHYQGIDDANRAFQTANMLYRSHSKASIGGDRQAPKTTRSVVFLNITRPYVDAASARVADMLLPTDDRAWEIKATPLPTLSQMQLTQLAQAMSLGDPVQAQQALEQQAEQAAEAAKKMQKAIEDPLVESNWHGEVRQVIEDAARCGSGVFKGPFPVMRSVRMTHEDPVTKIKSQIKLDEIKPGSKRIDFWNFFPDPACGENIHNGSYTWEREYIGKRQIKDLIKDESYDRAELLAVLREGPAKTREGTEAVHRHSDDEFEMWIFHGHCMRQQLKAMGVELDDDAEEHLPAMAVMINDRLVKAVLSPLESGEFPYDVLAWQRRPGMPWGMGISRQIRTVQRMLNGAVRAMMDNSGLSASPQIVIGNGIVPADGVYALSPGKIWRPEPGTEVPDARAAFSTFAVQSVQAELMNIINFALKMAEDTTGMPAMLQGIRGDAPNTLGGMQMQNNNATSVLRRLAKRFDDYMTRPHIQRYFDWMMTYSDDESIKGDFEIDVRASSALVERDAQQQFLMSLLQAAANPVYELDPAKLAAELCRGQRLDPKNFQLTDDQKAQRAQQGQDPTAQAKVGLIQAQTRKTDAQATGEAIKSQFAALQGAQVVESVPGTATTADGMLRSAGYKDQDAGPIVPQATGQEQTVDMPQSTDPLSPASPVTGMHQGIETQEPDSLQS